jgi:hypothetical protein
LAAPVSDLPLDTEIHKEEEQERELILEGHRIFPVLLGFGSPLLLRGWRSRI